MNWDAAIVKCVVCDRRKQYGKKIQFYRFPRDSGKCRSWVKVIGRKDLLSLTLDELHEKYVCDYHFPQECINQTVNRLHKVALPTLTTQLPPLNDDLLSDFLLADDRTEIDPIMNAKVDGLPKVRAYVRAPKATRHDPLPVVNYERPLMTCLETLLHNDQHYVKKPAGILNTISVPLLTYSSSLEKGTVFSACGPDNLLINANGEFAIKQKTISKTKPVNSMSFNKDTFAHDKDVTPTQNDSLSRYSNLKKYEKATIRPFKAVGLTDKLPDPALIDEITRSERTYTSFKDTMDIQSDHSEALIPTTYTNTDITCATYTEHDANVTPEESNAYVDEEWFDYRRPLMNCIEILNTGNTSISADCIEDSNTPIDVPLLNCFKTLEYTELLDTPSYPY